MIHLIWIPIVGAISAAAGTIIQRKILRKRKIDIGLYQIAEFLAIVLVLLPFLWFFWKIGSEALTTINLGIFALVIIFSLIANRFTYYSMKWEKVSNLEPAKVLEPLFTIILAIIFSFIIDSALYERNLNIIIPAILSGVALIFSHIKKHHLNFNKYFVAAIIGSLFFALELVTSRLILDFYSPITFYFLRCLAILAISFVLFKPHLKLLSSKVRWEVLGVGFVWSLYRIMLYYGYLKLGVVHTTLIIMLGPIFIYIFASKFLKEKLEWRNIVAAGVIVLSILYAILA